MKKRFSTKMMASMMALCCMLTAFCLPVKAEDANAEMVVWDAILEEYGLEKEDTSLVYEGMTRSAQGNVVAVKSENVDEDGNVEVTYYVPYSLDENEDLINSFSAAANNQTRSSSGNFTAYNVVFAYTANYSNISQSVSVGYLTFFLPSAFSMSYSLSGSGEVASITNLTGRYDIVCNLYATPYCLNTELPNATFTDYSVYAQFSKASPTASTTYSALTNMPSGYLARCEGGLQSGGVIATFTYRTSSGTVKTATGSIKIH